MVRAPLFLSVLLFACAHASGPEGSAQAPVGDRFDFRLMGLDGAPVEATDFRGKVVLVDIWATWCAPCEKSFPFYARLSKEHGPEFQVVAVSVDERSEDVEAWLEGRELPFVIAHDPEGVLAERIGLRTMPSAILLDREGRVAGSHAGFEEADTDKIERLVLRVLDEGSN